MKAYAVAGLGFGDEGKGTTVDALVEKLGAGLVVRYNGGAQAAHNVVRKGVHHTFAQFGAGTLAGAWTHLSRFMMVNPGAFFREAEHLETCGVLSPHQLVTVSPEALVTTPFHIHMNRLREALRGKDAHGTTGMGIGETRVLHHKHPDLAMKVKDLYSFERRGKLQAIWDHFMDEIASMGLSEYQVPPAFRDKSALDAAVDVYRKFAEHVVLCEDARLDRLMRRAKVTVFEGAQGILLDELHGFHPHTTWSDCTFDHVLDLIDDFDVDLVRLGVIRSYHTRHGAGPLPTENGSYQAVTVGDHNVGTNGFQGCFRAGEFDMVLARYARRAIGQLDGLVMTHLDKISSPETMYCDRYFYSKDIYTMEPDSRTSFLGQVEPRYSTASKEAFPELVANELNVPLVMTSSGRESSDKQYRWP